MNLDLVVLLLTKNIIPTYTTRARSLLQFFLQQKKHSNGDVGDRTLDLQQRLNNRSCKADALPLRYIPKL